MIMKIAEIKTDFKYISRKVVRLARLSNKLAKRYLTKKYQELYSTYKKSYAALDCLHYMINDALKKEGKDFRINFYSQSIGHLGRGGEYGYYQYNSYNWIAAFYNNKENYSCHKQQIFFFAADASTDYDAEDEEYCLMTMRGASCVC